MVSETDRSETGPQDPLRTDNDRIDEAAEDSFPASDPPSISPVVGTGAPAPEPDMPDAEPPEPQPEADDTETQDN